MLRTHRVPNVVPQSGFDAALQLCATRPDVHVFVAARLLAGGRHAVQNLVSIHPADDLRSMCWTSANVVPVEVAADEIELYAARLRRYRRRSSSLFGRSEQVLPLWRRLERDWGTPRTVRTAQPVMSMTAADLRPDVDLDPRVRPARPDEVDLVLPAAAHMFTGEIGYPPFYGSDREYRRLVAGLINRGHTYVMVQAGRVVFKADIGSLAFGVAQLQGVWVAPELRGRGLATPAMHAVVRHVLEHHARTVSLYVNDFNTAAIRTYERCGFRQVDTFSTVIL
ncbi:GNAT family N-acetyltransferase [Calidifontibacter terrae]